jgi:hypothetical protein
MNIRRSFLPVLPLMMCAMAAAAAAVAEEPQAMAEHKVAPGSSIRLHLESGGYQIQASDADKVTITYRTRSGEDLKQVHVDMKENGSVLSVYVRHTPNSNFNATIEVPRRSNLWVRLTAGDLVVEDIEGDKDIESRAGDVVIEVPHPEQYGHADGAVWAGDINASAFAIAKGGLFRSFDHYGPGKYRLHVHLLAGDLSLKAAS